MDTVVIMLALLVVTGWVAYACGHLDGYNEGLDTSERAWMAVQEALHAPNDRDTTPTA